MTTNVQVFPGKQGWEVKVVGEEEGPTQAYETRDEAIEHARRIARERQTDLLIHAEDGVTETRESYSGDAQGEVSHPPASDVAGETGRQPLSGARETSGEPPEPSQG